ncbi:MAG: TAXI family TRAP transporter solute-binding subunit, partial [Deltaproteobacteria bacterium]|nr:TAXI family TRAP transporter solute-binding subunit [Deltaproteobacteria bacterium]
YYATGGTVAKILSMAGPIQVRVQPYAGSTVVIPLVSSGELEFGINTDNDLRLAYRGEKPFPAAPGIRNVTILYPLLVALLVRNNSDIKTLADVKGRRVAGRYAAQLAVYFQVMGMLASGGLTWNDVRVVPVANVNDGVQALMEGRVEVASHAIGSAKVREADASVPGGVRHLAIDGSPEGARRMAQVFPGSFPYRLKAGHSPGIRADIPVMAHDVYITTGASQSEDTVYAITRLLWEKEAEIQKGGSRLVDFARKHMVKRETTIPYHPGAIRFYKEKGVWSAEMEARQAQLVKEAAGR